MRRVGTGGDIALTPEEWGVAYGINLSFDDLRDLAIIDGRRYQRYGSTPDGEILLCPRPVYREDA